MIRLLLSMMLLAAYALDAPLCFAQQGVGSSVESDEKNRTSSTRSGRKRLEADEPADPGAKSPGQLLREMTKDSVPTEAPAPVANNEELQGSLTYSVGVFAGTQVYYFQAYIGVIGDSYAGDVYDKETASALLGEVVSSTQVNVKTLEDLVKVIGVEERQSLTGMIDIFKLLNKQAAALEGFVKSGTQQDLDKYQQYRNESWPKIKTLLGLK